MFHFQLKFPGYIIYQNCTFSKWCTDRTPLWQNPPVTKSLWQNPPGTKSPWDKNPIGQKPPIIIIRGFCPTFKFGGFCPSGLCPRGILSHTYMHTRVHNKIWNFDSKLLQLFSVCIRVYLKRNFLNKKKYFWPCKNAIEDLAYPIKTQNLKFWLFQVFIHLEIQNKILRPMVKELAQLDLLFLCYVQITVNFSHSLK